MPLGPGGRPRRLNSIGEFLTVTGQPPLEFEVGKRRKAGKSLMSLMMLMLLSFHRLFILSIPICLTAQPPRRYHRPTIASRLAQTFSITRRNPLRTALNLASALGGGGGGEAAAAEKGNA